MDIAKLEKIIDAEQLLKKELSVGMERTKAQIAFNELLNMIEEFLQENKELTPQAHLELSVILDWTINMCERFSKSLPPIDPKILEEVCKPTDSPKPEGYLSAEEAVKWIESQPE